MGRKRPCWPTLGISAMTVWRQRGLSAGAAVRAWSARYQHAPAGRHPGWRGAAWTIAEQPGCDTDGDGGDGAGGFVAAGGGPPHPGNSAKHSLRDDGDKQSLYLHPTIAVDAADG